MRSLAIIQLASFGSALESVNVLPNYEGIEMLELIPLGGPTVLLLEGTFKELNYFRKNLRTADLQRSTILKYSERLMGIIYHKENQSPLSQISVLEAQFVGDLMDAVNDHLDEIVVLDFTLNRHFASLSSLTISSNSEKALREVQEKALKKNVKFTYFENPSRILKELFGSL